jgi:hypothetical protein
MKTLIALAAISLCLSSCGSGTTPEQDAAAENAVNNDINQQVTSIDDAQRKLKAAEAKQQPVTVGNTTVTADNIVDVGVTGAMQAAEQAKATNANSIAATDAYLTNGVK